MNRREFLRNSIFAGCVPLACMADVPYFAPKRYSTCDTRPFDPDKEYGQVCYSRWSLVLSDIPDLIRADIANVIPAGKARHSIWYFCHHLETQRDVDMVFYGSQAYGSQATIKAPVWEYGWKYSKKYCNPNFTEGWRYLSLLD